MFHDIVSAASWASALSELHFLRQGTQLACVGPACVQQLSGRALEAEGPGHEPRRRDELQFDAVLGADASQDDVFQRTWQGTCWNTLSQPKSYCIDGIILAHNCPLLPKHTTIHGVSDALQSVHVPNMRICSARCRHQTLVPCTKVCPQWWACRSWSTA